MSIKPYHLYLLIGLPAIALGAFFGYQAFFVGPTRPSEVTAVASAMRSGNYADARAKTIATLSDPEVSADTRAFTLYTSLGSSYMLTHDTNSFIEEIREMKVYITDPNVRLIVRVNLLNALANLYYVSNRERLVFEEVFSDEPYRSYLVRGDPEQSYKKLAEWSYELGPSSNAAILISRWYTTEVMNSRGLDSVTRAEYLKAGEDFLKKAEAANVFEVQRDPNYTIYNQYLTYRYWRAITILRLSKMVGEPYLSTYRSELESFIALSESFQGRISAKNLAMHARLRYAQRLLADSDTEASKTVLVQLAEDMRGSLNQPSTFRDFLVYESANNPLGIIWTQVLELAGISEEFRSALSDAVGRAI